MKAGPIEVGKLLQNQYRYCVPIYQRHYVWRRPKWEPFWNDIRVKAMERLSGRDRRYSHYMGAVVLETRGGFSARKVPAFQVVDGQQRLTTFQIFLAAARDYANFTNQKSSAERIVSYLLNPNPHLMEDPDIEIFKVWPTEADRKIFIDVINLGGREKLRKKYREYFYKRRDQIYDYRTTPTILAAYGYFYDRIRHAIESDELEDEFAEPLPDPEDEGDEPEQVALPAQQQNGDIPRELKLDAIWQALVEEFKVVEISLEEGDDAQVIFETLNDRGEPLLAADLVRNNIFYRADDRKENPEKLFKTIWKPFEAKFWGEEEKQGRYKKPRIEFFLGNFIAGQIAGEINLTKLFSEYKAFIKNKKYPTVAAEIEDLAAYGEIYRELIERKSDSALAQFSRRLLPWDVTTVFPLVLRLWANSDVADEEKATILNLLMSYIVRRAVCGLTPKNYNKFFLTVIPHLEKAGWRAGALSEFLIKQTADSARFPRDAEFEQKWIEAPLYNSIQPGRAAAILREIEVAGRTKMQETTALAPRLTVEHIMPVKWPAHWPLQDGELATKQELSEAIFSFEEGSTRVGAIIRRNRMLHTIGNLTLLTQSLNSHVSNGPWEQKRKALQDKSLLIMNRDVTREETWDEDKIVARSKSLFGLAKTVWPYSVSLR
jgi:uncharacterized protein with ParB-like and HNH nuclease domain